MPRRKSGDQLRIPKGYGPQKREYVPILVMSIVVLISALLLYFCIGMGGEEIFGYILVAIMTSAVLIIMFTYMLGRRK